MSEGSSPRGPRLLVVSGLVGTAATAILFAVGGPASDPISLAILTATLAVVPLGLSILPPAGGTADRLRAAVAILQPPAGAAVLTSLVLPAGRDAGLFASAWMVVALACATLGLARLFQRGLRDGPTLASSAALLYLPVGAGWLVTSRMGARPLELDSLIVALTAVHFHYSAFAAPLLASRAVEALAGRPRRVALASAIGVVIAQPIVAAGITASPSLALAGALLLALALVALSILTIGWVQRTVRSAIARAVLVLSALPPFLSMPLALAWSWGEVAGVRPIGLEGMIAWHGTLNAYGFALTGIVAWVLASRRPR